MGAALLLSACLATPAFAKANKTTICHPAGNSGNVLTLEVATASVPAHLAHGDWLQQTFYVDADGDGVGDTPVLACVQPTGTAVVGGDCNDNDATISPLATEICGNGIDDDCDGQADEGCLVDVEITMHADNAWWLWIDGVVYHGPNAASWQPSDTFQLQLPPGQHSVAVYVEDWGGRAWIAATVKAAGQVVRKTGDGQWKTTGSLKAAAVGSSYQRGLAWSAGPADGSTGLLTAAPYGWHLPSYNHSAWQTAVKCTYRTDQKMSVFAALTASVYDAFDTLYADGAEFVWTQANCYPGSGGGWNIGLFRTTFTL
ncbi:MAG: putative metal-binding motif-containing protein [Deltaproteobacteria bacterium]|nr:putative metal-binding motif-containing protein [Deltaproteobacteria bacterium]